MRDISDHNRGRRHVRAMYENLSLEFGWPFWGKTVSLARHEPAECSPPALATLDDMLGNGGLNQVKKWWRDLELSEDGAYRPIGETRQRGRPSA